MFKTNVAGEYPDYLRDESRRTGRAESISFPVSESDVVRDLEEASRRQLLVTIQGARTGITGGAVPEGGHVLNVSRMNRIVAVRESGEDLSVTLQPGVLLSELRSFIAGKAAAQAEGIPGSGLVSRGSLYFFPPDPTETSASLGGMVACNASGARSFHYGPTRRYVDRLRLVLADGERMELRRGVQKAEGRRFLLKTEPGRQVTGTMPSYRMPELKNASGFYAADDMDMIDLIVGAEGTIGVVSELDVRLVREPAVEWGIMAFFPSEEAAIKFVRGVRHEGQCRPVAVEFFDSHALDMLRRQKRANPAFQEISEMPEAWNTGVYVEYHGPDEAAVEEGVQVMCDLMADAGGKDDATWIGSNERDMEALKFFRHAVPESVNLTIDERRKREPRLTKLGTDLAVPDDRLEEVMAMYHEGLARCGLEHVIFGHIGNNHVHVNIIPNDLDEYGRGKDLYLEWADRVVAMGGTVSAEHGVGKLKTALLRRMYGEQGIQQMLALKRVFDPKGMLNRGNLFDWA